MELSRQGIIQLTQLICSFVNSRIDKRFSPGQGSKTALRHFFLSVRARSSRLLNFKSHTFVMTRPLISMLGGNQLSRCCFEFDHFIDLMVGD